MLSQLKINFRIISLVFSNFSPLCQQHQSTKHSKMNPWQYYCGKKEVIYLESKYINYFQKCVTIGKSQKFQLAAGQHQDMRMRAVVLHIISWVLWSPSNEPPCLSNLLPMSTLNFSICGAPYFQYHNFFENHEMPLLLHIHLEKSS